MYGVIMQYTVQTLLAQGKSERAISRELGIHRDVVRRLKKEAREELLPICRRRRCIALFLPRKI